MPSLIAPILSLAMLPSQGAFALRDGDRVLFYGDSITDNQFYPQYVETYVVTRFPEMKVTFINSGWSGDKVGGGGGGDIAKRLTRDVFPYKPTVVTIMLGMNDGLYKAWDDAVFRTYTTGYERIVDALKANGNPRLTLIKPSAFDDVTQPPTVNGGGYNIVLQRYGDYVGTLGQKTGATVADFNTPLVDALVKARSIDADGAKRLIFDRIHPTSAAHIVLGDALLEAWHAPSLVSSVQIDSDSGVSRAENSTVRNLRTSSRSITWRALDGSLPVFFDKSLPGVALVLKSTNVFANVNQQFLKVTGLDPGSYSLAIDGEEEGKFTSEQLRAGINLAELNTPMMKQAATVSGWTARRQFLRQTTWRSVLVGMDGLEERDQAVKALEKLEGEVVERQRAAAQPVWHTFKLAEIPRIRKRASL